MFKWTLPMGATVWIPIFFRCGTPYPPSIKQETKKKKIKYHKPQVRQPSEQKSPRGLKS